MILVLSSITSSLVEPYPTILSYTLTHSPHMYWAVSFCKHLAKLIWVLVLPWSWAHSLNFPSILPSPRSYCSFPGTCASHHWLILVQQINTQSLNYPEFRTWLITALAIWLLVGTTQIHVVLNLWMVRNSGITPCKCAGKAANASEPLQPFLMLLQHSLPRTNTSPFGIALIYVLPSPKCRSPGFACLQQNPTFLAGVRM